ncbi:hypothetical protein [Nocardioides sp.]|uniref:hypothetical protein n=1 Tax=Nocardioides sp. TaxID=35761 RepID=UPI00286AC83B|nr:hypothetical protein [Nocardioides sp.]
MGLWSRIGVVVTLLALPLGLAVASQALAERPGDPSVPTTPVLVDSDLPPEPAQSPSSPATRPPSAPSPGPLVVTPSAPVATGQEGDGGDSDADDRDVEDGDVDDRADQDDD